MANKTLIGFITFILVASGASYYIFNTDIGYAELRIDDDKSILYNNLTGKRLISAISNDRLFEGNNLIKRVKSSIYRERFNYTNGLIGERRITGYKNGEVITHSWLFNPVSDEIEHFPIDEEICTYNASGKFYRYTLSKLKDAGIKRKLVNGETSIMFGYNVKLTFDKGYNWAWVGWPYKSDTFSIQYKIKSDNECFNIRLFDPVIGSLNYSLNGNLSYVPNWTLLVYENGTVNVSYIESGNFTTTMNELNIPLYPGNTSYTYNLTNKNVTNNITVSVKINETKDWFDWKCLNKTIETSFIDLTNVTKNSSLLINCTLDLINATQTYINWSQTVNNATWNFNPTFNSTEI